MSKISEAFFIERVTRARARGGARDQVELVRIGAKCGVTGPRAKRLAVDAGWPSLEALHRTLEGMEDTAAGGGGSGSVVVREAPPQVVEVRVPVEVATLYLDHESPLVQACARVIADDYRRLERMVGVAMVKPEPHPNGEPVPGKRRWTPEEDALVLSGAPHAEVAASLERTVKAVQLRSVKLKRASLKEAA